MKQVSSILITIIFLSGQIGIYTSTHICGGELSNYSIGIVEADLGCGMEKGESSSCERDNSIKASSCCNDIVVNLKVTDSFKSQNKEINFDASFAIVKESSIKIFNRESDFSLDFISYIPPPLIRDIPVLIQSFLL